MEQEPLILVVDDDREIRDLLARFLKNHAFRVATAADGKEMWSVLEDRGVDLIVLDLMLPGEDGLSLCAKLRNQTDIPVIMLTAMGEETDRIVGLEIGADDYLPKPFNPRELLARMKAVMRRVEQRPRIVGAEEAGAVLSFDDWTLDRDSRRLLNPEGDHVHLSTGEYDLLVVLASHPGRVLSRDQLLDLARGRDAQPYDRSIDVQISRLRRKLELDPKEPTLIKTVRGGGYLFSPTVKAKA
ncbi:MAG: response regulator [Magnetovibrionaceae bacterium]